MMTKTPVPDRRPMFAQARKGGDANRPERTSPNKPQPRPSEGGANSGSATTGDEVALPIFTHHHKDEERPQTTVVIKGEPAKRFMREAARPSEGRAKPSNAGLPVVVRLQPDLLARLDKTIKPGQTRPQAIRETLDEHLP